MQRISAEGAPGAESRQRSYQSYGDGRILFPEKHLSPVAEFLHVSLARQLTAIGSSDAIGYR